MSKKRRGLPRMVTIQGKRYVLKAALINTKNEDGVPRNCTILEDDKSVNLAGGEEFMTLYIPIVMNNNVVP